MGDLLVACRAEALASFARLFGREGRSPRRYLEYNWGTQRHSGGCPVALMGPGALVDFVEALWAPVGLIH